MMNTAYLRMKSGEIIELPIFYKEEPAVQKMLPAVEFKGYIYFVDDLDARMDVAKVGYTRKEVE